MQVSKTEFQKKEEWKKRYSQALSENKIFDQMVSRDLVAKSAEGLRITDFDGTQYLDFGNSMVLLGHSNPRVASKLSTDLQRHLVGGTQGWAMVETRVEFAEELKSNLRGVLNERGKVAYCSSGAEATDYAIGLAREFSKKKVIISFFGSYHGFTGATLAVNGIDPSDGVHRIPSRTGTVTIPFPDCHHDEPHKEPECSTRCVDEFQKTLDNVVSPEDVAAVIFEPIEVNAGILVPTPSFWKDIFKICEKNEILTIADEVFTGFGKTGKFLGTDNYGVLPDIVCFGKGVGGTLPLGAIVARDEILDNNLKPNCNSSSAGNPLACIAGTETMRIINEDRLLGKVSKYGRYIHKKLEELQEENKDLIGDVRGMGVVQCIEVGPDSRSNPRKYSKTALEIVERAYKRGLLIGRRGIYRNVVSFTPCLTVTETEIDEMIGIMDAVLRSIRK